ncbi:WD40 repeat-like protein, partial [Ceratobasidium sp. AG-I]
IWDTETGVELFELPPGHENPVRSIAFTLDGRYIVSGSDDATVRIWDTETGTAVAEPLKGHLYGVNSIALSSDGRLIATGSEDTTVRIWDMESLHTNDQLVVSSLYIDHLMYTNRGEQIDELFTAPLKQSISTSVLAHYINKGGWVTSSTGALLLWLPKQRQRRDDSLIQISTTPTPNHVLLDFSRFVHGNSWASI